jgi:hypothetical protein
MVYYKKGISREGFGTECVQWHGSSKGSRKMRHELLLSFMLLSSCSARARTGAYLRFQEYYYPGQVWDTLKMSPEKERIFKTFDPFTTGDVSLMGGEDAFFLPYFFIEPETLP